MPPILVIYPTVDSLGYEHPTCALDEHGTLNFIVMLVSVALIWLDATMT